MTDTYKDLDALVPDDKSVKLGGVTYEVPGDLPLEIYVRVNKASEKESESEQDAIDLMVSAMVDLFAWLYQDKPEENRVRNEVSKVLRARGLRFNTRLIQSIYGEDMEDRSSEEEVPPTK